MMDFTANWGWPQWVLLILMFLSLVYHCARHGEERKDKGEPEKFSGFVAMTRFALMMFILIAGGFFA